MASVKRQAEKRRAQKKQRAKSSQKSRNQKRNSGIAGITTIIYIYLLFISYYLLCASFYACLLYLLSSCAILYTCFFLAFISVIDSKAQHMRKKRHGKKPLQFCNIKKLVKSSTYRLWAMPFFGNPFWALHFSNMVTIWLQ